MHTAVVVRGFGPGRKIGELVGELVEGRERIAEARRAGAVLLPIERERHAEGGIAAYMRREWGAGVVVDNPAPHILCPMTMRVGPGERFVYWAASLLPIGDVVAGSIVFTQDYRVGPGTPSVAHGKSSPIDVSEIEELRRGEAIVGGRLSFSVFGPGVMTFGLWARGTGYKISWSACTHSAQEE